MGEKKKKEESTKTVKKVLIVGACVLFVVLMILSGMGSGWLTMFTSVKPGDSVTLDYTLYDAAGKSIVTSEKSVYDTAIAQNRQIFGSKQLHDYIKPDDGKTRLSSTGISVGGDKCPATRDFFLGIQCDKFGYSWHESQ